MNAGADGGIVDSIATNFVPIGRFTNTFITNKSIEVISCWCCKTTFSALRAAKRHKCKKRHQKYCLSKKKSRNVSAHIFC